jgi:DNA-binding LacI/PurR family transcriptional regulator
VVRRSTLQDIARLAGVSRSAAARVLLGTGGESVRVSEGTGKRIRRAAAQLDYTPNRFAQQLRGVSSRTLGVIIETENIPVMTARLFALEHEASQRGYRLLIGRTHEQRNQLRDYVLDFSGRGVEAIFCLFDLGPKRDQWAREVFRNSKKVVFHGRPAWERGYCVKVDTIGAIHSVVDHLVARGKRNPALALWNMPKDELMSVRRGAFNEALAKHKIRARDKLVWDAASLSVNPTQEAADRGIEKLVRQGGADAILASNDVWAVRFMFRLKEIGLRIPEDVAVIGYDNLDIGEVIAPSLTTIDQSHQDYAAAAVDLLIRLAQDEPIPVAKRTVTVPSRLIIRHSS